MRADRCNESAVDQNSGKQCPFNVRRPLNSRCSLVNRPVRMLAPDLVQWQLVHRIAFGIRSMIVFARTS
jgi:hypothetical protein